MIRYSSMILALLTVTLAFLAGAEEPPQASVLRLLFSEVQAGAMASEQYCALVFVDRRFHYEKASRNVGRDREREIYEGQLSQTDFDTLMSILDSKDFRDLNVPQEAAPV